MATEVVATEAGATEAGATAEPTTPEPEAALTQVASASSVLAVVVVRTGSHPGLRQVRPTAVLDAVDAQTSRPGRVVVVEVRTGTPRHPAEAGPVVPAPRLGVGAGPANRIVLEGPATFASAVTAAVQAVGPLAPDGFVWILRDDVVPAPDALGRLVSYAGLDPSASVFGTKVVDAAAVVVEAGVSVDAAGRRVTGVVPGERDRGRHDAVRDVLAVGFAGTLVRGRAWNALGGLVTTSAADVEFGWRACAAGMRVVVVPSATVVVTRPASRQAGSDRAFRVGALRLRLGFAALWALPAVWLGVVLGGARRAGWELVRGRPRRAADEARSAFEAAFRLAPVRRARQRFAVVRQVPRPALAPLFPSRFGRWDDTRRPLGRVALHRRDATYRHADGVRRRGTNHPIWMVAVALLGLGLLAGALVPGPGLAAHSWDLPWPVGARQVWDAVLSSWQPAGAGLGGDGPAPAWLVVVALAATATGGRPELAADLLLLAGPPLAALSCYRALSGSRALTTTDGARRGLVLVAASCHALSPAMAAAVHRGRIDVVLALVALPLAVAAAAQLLGRADGRRGGLAASAQLALALAVVAAGAPSLLVVAALALAASVTTMVPRGRRRARSGQVGVALLAATIPLWPSWRRLVDDPSMLLTGGETSTWPAAVASSHTASATISDAMIGEVGLAATAVFGVPLAVAALVGMLAYRSQPAVVGGCLLFAAAAATSVAVASVADPAVAVGARAACAGAAVAGLLLAAVAAADWTPRTLRGRPFGWRQPAAAALALSFGVAPGLLAASFVSDSGWRARVPATADRGELARLAALARSCPPGSRLLVVAGGVEPSAQAAQRAQAGVVRYTLTSADGPRFGDAPGRPPPAARQFLASAVGDLYAGGGRFSSSLAVLGACAAVVPEAAAPRGLVAALDAAPGLVRQAYRPGLLVWRPADGPGTGPAPAAAAAVVYAGPAAEAATRPPTGPDLAAGLPARPLPGNAVAHSARLPAGDAGRVVVLTEPASRQWTARLDGVALPAATAWGWAQAFRLPATGGELRIELDHGSHRWIVAGQLAAVAGLAAVAAAVPDRRAGAGAGTGRVRRGRLLVGGP